MLNVDETRVKNVRLVLPAMHPKQYEFYHRPERFVVGCCGSKFGKAVSVDSNVLTESGMKLIGDIKVGDHVFAVDGNPTKVIRVTKIMEGHVCYKLVFSDKSSAIVDAGHLWATYTKHGPGIHDWICSVKTTEEIKNTIYLNHRLPDVPHVNIVRYITKCEKVQSVPVKCISIDHPQKLFLLGDSFIPTHNSFGGAVRLISDAWNHEGWIIWWVAPVYGQTKIGIDEIVKLIPQNRYKFYKADMVLELLKDGGKPYSRIEFKSAQDADKLRGFKVNLALLDEADRMSEEAFVSVYTTLAPVRGRAYIISTPKSRGGFFFQEWMKGQQDSPTYDPNYFSMSMPTSCNPFIDKEIIEQARKNMPEDIFRTEYLAEWPESSEGQVFRGVQNCIQGTLEEPIPRELYVMGVDLAKHHDFTVITVVRKTTKQVVHYFRTNSVDWNIIKQHIINTAMKYNKAHTIMDTTSGSVGDVILDNIKDLAQFQLEGYKIQTNNAKKQLVECLRLAIQEQRIFFPPIPQLLLELRMFEYEVMESGVVTYSAPRGSYDDSVISLCLACWGLEREDWKYTFKRIRGV